MTFKDNSLKARDLRAILHPATNLVAHREQGPLVIDHGKGIHVWESQLSMRKELFDVMERGQQREFM